MGGPNPEPGAGAPAGAQRWADYLEWLREDLITAVLALPPVEQREMRTPSGWSPLELLNHVLHMEQRWFQWGFLGEPVDDPWGDWNVPEPWTSDDSDETKPSARWQVDDDVGADELAARLRVLGSRTRAVLLENPLDAPAAAGGRLGQDPPTLEWICFHVLAEYARHAGHLDVSIEILRGRPSGDPEFVRPPRAHSGPIHLASPDPAWPGQYAAVAARIRQALGPLAVLVEHVGSTSVPGLAAKPILDVLLLVPDPTDEAAYVTPLEGAGFLLHLREPDWHQHRLFKAVDPEVNLHVFADGSPEAERMLLFRDHVRANEEDRVLYESTKRRLAAGSWNRVQDYADAKSDVVEAIIARAAAATSRTQTSSR